jgi:hypothetical protein
MANDCEVMDEVRGMDGTLSDGLEEDEYDE